MKVQKIGFVAIPVTEIKRARVQGTSGALAVEDFDAAILKLKVAVIRFAMEPFETPGCHMAVVQDPDGNKLMIHKLKLGRET